MRIFSNDYGVVNKSVKTRDHFAFIPMIIQRPSKGILWLEFYGKAYEYYNGAWHFVGILHKDFNVAQFEEGIGGKYIRITWQYPNFLHRLLYFLRIILVALFWVATIFGSILLVHKYM